MVGCIPRRRVIFILVVTLRLAILVGVVSVAFIYGTTRNMSFPYVLAYNNSFGFATSDEVVLEMHAKMAAVMHDFEADGTYPYINATHAEHLQEVLRSSSINSFCEGRYGGMDPGRNPNAGWFFPESYSSLTAIWIGVCGTFMLRTWQTDSPFVMLLAALFVANGVFSFLTHFTGVYRCA